MRLINPFKILDSQIKVQDVKILKKVLYKITGKIVNKNVVTVNIII